MNIEQARKYQQMLARKQARTKAPFSGVSNFIAKNAPGFTSRLRTTMNKPANLTQKQAEALQNVSYAAPKFLKTALSHPLYRGIDILSRGGLSRTLDPTDPNSWITRNLLSGVASSTTAGNKAGETLGTIAELTPALMYGLAGGSTFKTGKLSQLPTLAQKTISTILPNAAIGAGINKAFGGSLLEGAKQGLLNMPTTVTIGQFTNPLISKITGGAYDKVSNPLVRQIVTRGVSGALNVGEGKIMDISLGQKTTPTSVAIDLVSGILLVPDANRELKNQLVNAISDNNIDAFEQTIKQAKNNGVKINDVKVKEAEEVMKKPELTKQDRIKLLDEQIKNEPDLAKRGLLMAERNKLLDETNPERILQQKEMEEFLVSNKKKNEEVAYVSKQLKPVNQRLLEIKQEIIDAGRKAKGSVKGSPEWKKMNDLVKERDALILKQKSLVYQRDIKPVEQIKIKTELPKVVEKVRPVKIKPVPVPNVKENKVVTSIEDIRKRVKPSIKTEVEETVSAIKSTKQQLEQNRLMHEGVEKIHQKLVLFDTYMDAIDRKYGKGSAEKLLDGEVEFMKNDTESKEMADHIKRIFHETDDVEKLKSIGAYRENYIPRASEEQYFDTRIGLKFLNSPLKDFSNIYDPLIARNPDSKFVGDLSLKDRLTLRLYATFTNAMKETRKLDPKKSIIDQIQKLGDRNKLIDYDEKIGIFGGKGMGKPILQTFTSQLEAPYYGWVDTKLWEPYIKPIMMGQAELPAWRANMFERFKNGGNLAEILTSELGLKPDSKEYSDMYGEIATMLGKTKPDKLDMVANIAIKNVGDEIFKNRPLTNLEEWIKTHNITDNATKNFIDRELKSILTNGYEETNLLTKGLNYFRRLEQLAMIGLKVSTAILQPFETVRAWAKFDPKSVAIAYKDAFGDINYQKYLDQDIYDPLTGDLKSKEFFKQKDIVDKVLSKLEDAGFKGMAAAERWKNKVFLRAAELDGINKGLSGKELDNFVYENYIKYSHNYTGITLPNASKNPFVKFGFMFSTYPLKQIGLLVRTVEDIVGKQPGSTKFLIGTLIGTYAQYLLFQKIFNNDKNNWYTTLTGGGIPKPYNPIVDVGKNVYGMVTAKDKEDYDTNKYNLGKNLNRTVVPYGNQIFNTTVPAAQDLIRGYAVKPDGTKKYDAPKKPLQALASLTISRYSNDEARAYYDKINKYYKTKEDVLKELKDDEISAFNAIPKSDPEDPLALMYKYETYLKYPSVYDAKKLIAIQSADGNLSKVDPLYTTDSKTARNFILWKSLPPGSQDAKDLKKAHPDIVKLAEIRTKFFEENPIEGVESTYKAPKPSEYVQKQMDAKNWKDPQVKAYLEAYRVYTNEQRAKIGLEPIPEYESSYNPMKYFNPTVKKVKMKKVKSKKLSFKKPKKIKTKYKKLKVKKLAVTPIRGLNKKIKIPELKNKKGNIIKLKA